MRRSHRLPVPREGACEANLPETCPGGFGQGRTTTGTSRHPSESWDLNALTKPKRLQRGGREILAFARMTVKRRDGASA